MSFSQFNIDIYLVELFKNKKDGFFIEAGANDGVSQSNTFLLERDLKWNGILVEPNINAFNKCVKNRNCIIENKALVSFDYTNNYIEGDFDSIDFTLSMMGGCTNSHKKTTKVEAIQLSKLLKKHNIKEIDLFSIDVEGYEIDVLNGINFDEHSPNYILFESHQQLGVLVDHKEYFYNIGYKLSKVFSDNHFLYVKNKI